MIHGSSPGPAIFMRNPDPANWGKWSLIPHPELWQAVCLSMDIEPPKSCDVVEFLRLEQNTFNDRMQVYMANIGPPPRPEAARVNLATFAAVVSNWGWPIPQQLQAIAQHAPTPATTAITAPSVKAVRHSTKGTTRRRTLRPEIEHAQSLCKNRCDSAEVWGALQIMAEKKYGQLIGATEDGLQYLESGDVKIFTRNALGKRLKTRPPT